MAEDAQPQGPADAQGGRFGAGQSRLKEVEGLLEVFSEASADRSQAHAPASAIEQDHAETPFLSADGLADAGLGHVEPFGGAAEVQFLGQRQEDLDVAQLHR
jgi:hypothetical protein